MIGKPDVYILTGESGKKAYEHICNAHSSKTLQYTDKERKEFNVEFSKIIPEIIKNWDKVLKPAE